MKLQKTTWSLSITALFLCAVVYIHEIKFQQQQSQIELSNNRLFNFTEEDIKNITIETKHNTLKFQRTEDDRNRNFWKMTKPKQKNANNATISFLINLLVTGESNRRFRISTSRQKDYGLNKPLATIEVMLNDESKHQIVLGDSNFNDSFLYAKVDSNDNDTAELIVSLVSKNYQYAIDRKIDEWLEMDELSEKKVDSKK